MLLVIVNYLYFVYRIVEPAKAYSPLVIDSDAVLASTIAGQFLQTIPGRRAQIVQRRGAIQDNQFALRKPLDILRQRLHPLTGKYIFSKLVPKRLNQA